MSWDPSAALGLTVLALLGATGCTSYSIAGGPSRSRDVIGAASGWGQGLEGGGARCVAGGDVGAWLTAETLAYDTGDGVTLDWVGVSIRYRALLRGRTRVTPYLAVGGGPGYHGGYQSDLVVEGHVELGTRLPLTTTLALTAGVSERPLVLIGSDTHAYNAMQLSLGLEMSPSSD